MRSRLGEPITVAGNPPVKFASADFESENEDQILPGLRLFMTRVFLNDIFSMGILGATVMGGATIEPETTLLPLSLVLREMCLPTATYEGSPVEPYDNKR